MITKGQIVEIPATSPIFDVVSDDSLGKKEQLQRKLAVRNYELFDGFLVGEHDGTSKFKLGQRKGINVGGKKAPLYVIGINTETNQLFVGEGEDHPGLWTTVLGFPNESRSDIIATPEETEMGIEVSIHSSVTDIDMIATLYLFDETLYLEFEAPISINIQDNPLEIYFDNHNSSTIKIN